MATFDNSDIAQISYENWIYHEDVVKVLRGIRLGVWLGLALICILLIILIVA